MNARIKKVINTLGIPRLIIIGLLVVILTGCVRAGTDHSAFE